ncbi:MAG TPA: RelA/SpoT domain-containing protein [Terriglobales bacterium]|nr:RelA/SpoT domain-containing protein [Terriglobales bacterium]
MNHASSSRSSVRRAAERLRAGQGSSSDEAVIREFRNRRASALVPACQLISDATREERVLFTARLKRFEAILRKTIRLRTDVTRMEDIVGIRVIVGGAVSQERLRHLLEERPEFQRTQDYLASSRIDGYRGLHIVMQLPTADGEAAPVEVQLRTYAQHLWASLSEAFGQQVKEGAGPPSTRDLLHQLSERLSLLEAGGLSREIEISAAARALTYWILHFDLRSASVLDCLDMDQDVSGAIESLMVYEGGYQQTSKYETVLLCSGDTKGVEETHIRYFPEALVKSLTNWAGIQLPDWALAKVLTQRTD